jgi:hypothetical protein
VYGSSLFEVVAELTVFLYSCTFSMYLSNAFCVMILLTSLSVLSYFFMFCKGQMFVSLKTCKGSWDVYGKTETVL